MRVAAAFTSSALLRLRATPPASVLWAMAAEETLSVTGKPSCLGRRHGVAALQTRPSGTARPWDLRSCLASNSLNVRSSCRASRSSTTAGGASRRAQLRPMKAAASKAVKRIVETHHGGNAVAASSSARASGMHSGKRGHHGGAGLGGVGRIDQRPGRHEPGIGPHLRIGGNVENEHGHIKPPPSTAEKVAVSFSSSFQMKV